jgi:NAD(P)-dependent dehydrogenase (short-subunit alcohol dehydrogenase family)
MADVTSSAEVGRAASSIRDLVGDVRAVVNVAGDNRIRPTTEVADDEWRYLIDVNLSSAFYCSREFLPTWCAAATGRVVNFSSIFGLRGHPQDAAYSAAKAGVIGLTRALALEFASSRVTVNSIAPVVVMTPRVASFAPEHLQRQLDRIPLGRFCTVDDVVSTVRFLFTEAGSFYTGQTFSPNGGDLML